MLASGSSSTEIRPASRRGQAPDRAVMMRARVGGVKPFTAKTSRPRGDAAEYDDRASRPVRGGCVPMDDNTDFAPEQPIPAAPRYFDDLTVGERFYIPSRTMTEALFAAFQLASADNHPIHYDRVYCQAHGHRDLLAHGLLVTAQAAAGAGMFPHVIGDSLIAFLDQSSRFLKP